MNTIQKLEEKLFSCWNVVDDIEFFYNTQEVMTEDEQMNFLLGLMTKYKYLFSDMFEQYEVVTDEYYRMKKIIKSYERELDEMRRPF